MKNINIDKFVIISSPILFVLVTELAGIWVLIPYLLGLGEPKTYYVFIQGLGQFLFVMGFIYLLNKRSLDGLIIKAEGKWYLISALLGSSFILIQLVLNFIYNFLLGTAYHIKFDFNGFSQLNDINLLAPILIIPIAEEFFFRGYVQKELQKKINPWLAIGITSILFAIIHFPPAITLDGRFFDWSLWHQVYITFWGGFLSGIIYFKSKSIIPSIIFHVFWNLIAFVL